MKRLFLQLGPALLIVTAALALFWPVAPLAGGPRARVIWDSYDFSYPYAAFVSRCYRHGLFPLWNPFSFSGSQFLGSLQNLMFNPLNVLFAVSGPMTLARFQALHLAQILLGAFGYLAWARARGASTLAGTVAALAFLGCGSVVNFFSHHMQLSLFCLLPYPFAAFAMWDRTHRVRWLLATTLGLAAWGVTSYPSQLGYYSVAFGVYYLACRRRVVPLELVLLGVFPLLLTALHLLPGLELLSRVTRTSATTLPETFVGSVRPTQLGSLILGSLATQVSRFRGPNWTLRDFSVGLAALFLIFVALTRPTRARLLLLLGAVLCIDAMLGARSLLMPLWFKISPFTRGSRYATVDFGSLLPFLLLTLAIDGVEELRQNVAWRRLAVAFALLVASWALARKLAELGWMLYPVDWRRIIWIEPAIVFYLVAGAVVALRWRRWLFAALLLTSVALGSYFDVHGNQQILWYEATPESFADQAREYGEADAGYFDLDHKLRLPVWPKPSNWNLVNGESRSDSGYDSMFLQRSEDVARLEPLRDVNLNAAQLFVVDRVEITSQPRPLLPARVATLLAPLPAGPLADPASVHVQLHTRLNSQQLTVDSPRAPSLLVLNELFVPGWTLEIDGHPAPLLEANGAFRALYVPAGRHECELRFRPPLFRLALILTLLGWLLLGPALYWARRVERS